MSRYPHYSSLPPIPIDLNKRLQFSQQCLLPEDEIEYEIEEQNGLELLNKEQRSEDSDNSCVANENGGTAQFEQVVARMNSQQTENKVGQNLRNFLKNKSRDQLIPEQSQVKQNILQFCAVSNQPDFFTYSLNQNSLLPAQLVDKQSISTPLQYHLAVQQRLKKDRKPSFKKRASKSQQHIRRLPVYRPKSLSISAQSKKKPKKSTESLKATQVVSQQCDHPEFESNPAKSLIISQNNLPLIHQNQRNSAQYGLRMMDSYVNTDKNSVTNMVAFGPEFMRTSFINTSQQSLDAHDSQPMSSLYPNQFNYEDHSLCLIQSQDLGSHPFVPLRRRETKSLIGSQLDNGQIIQSEFEFDSNNRQIPNQNQKYISSKDQFSQLPLSPIICGQSNIVKCQNSQRPNPRKTQPRRHKKEQRSRVGSEKSKGRGKSKSESIGNQGSEMNRSNLSKSVCSKRASLVQQKSKDTMKLVSKQIKIKDDGLKPTPIVIGSPSTTTNMTSGLINYRDLVTTPNHSLQFQADKFYHQILKRRYFCFWIETFIRILKQRIVNSSDNNIPLIGIKQHGWPQRNILHFNTYQNSKQGTNSDLIRKVIQNIPTSKRDVLIRDQSKQTVPISQGFFDNILSPNSSWKHTNNPNTKQENAVNQNNEDLSRKEAELLSGIQEISNLNADLEISSQKELSLSKQQPIDFKEQMNTLHILTSIPDAAQSGKIGSEEQLDSELSQKLKQTAHLGEMDESKSQKSKRSRSRSISSGLRILKKFKNKQLNDYLKEPKIIQTQVRDNSKKKSESNLINSTLRQKKKPKIQKAFDHSKSVDYQSKDISKTVQQQGIRSERVKECQGSSLMRRSSTPYQQSCVSQFEGSGTINQQKKYFSIWKQLLLCKSCHEVPKSQQLHQIYLQRMCMRVLRRHQVRRWCLRKKYEQISCQQRAGVVREFLIKWIEQFNQEVIERQKQEKADSLRRYRLNSKVLRCWVRYVVKKQRFRSKLARFVSLNCLLRIINKDSSLRVSVDLKRCVEQMKVRYYDEYRLEQILYLYHQDLVKITFQYLRIHTAQIIHFRKQRRLNLINNILAQFKYTLSKRKLDSKRIEFIKDRRVMRMKMLIVEVLKREKRMRSGWREVGQEIERRRRERVGKKVMEELRNHRLKMKSKKQILNKTQSLFNKIILKRSLKSLKNYFNCQLKKKKRLAQIKTQVNKLKLRRFLNTLRQGISKLSRLNYSSEQVKKITEARIKKYLITAWNHQSQETRYVRIRLQKKLLSWGWRNLRQGVFVQMVEKQLKERAASFRRYKLKKQVILSLRVYQEWWRRVETEGEEHMERMKTQRLGQILKSLKTIVQMKKREQKRGELAEMKNREVLMRRVVRRLRQKVIKAKLIKAMTISRYTTLLKSSWRLLVGMCKKQREMRELVELLVEKRNRTRANKVLNHWNTKMYRKMQWRIHTEATYRYLAAKRLFIRLGTHSAISQSVKVQQDQAYQLANSLILSRVIKAWRDYMHTDKIVASRKSRRFRTLHLLQPCLEGLRRWKRLKAIQREKVERYMKKVKLELFRRWIDVRRWGREVERVRQVREKILERRVVEALKEWMRRRREKGRKMEMAQRHFFVTLSTLVFRAFKLSKLIRLQSIHSRIRNSKIASLFFQSRVFRHWRLCSMWTRSLKRSGDKVRKLANIGIKRKYLKIMRDRLRERVMQKRVIEMRNKWVERRGYKRWVEMVRVVGILKERGERWRERGVTKMLRKLVKEWRGRVIVRKQKELRERRGQEWRESYLVQKGWFILRERRERTIRETVCYAQVKRERLRRLREEMWKKMVGVWIEGRELDRRADKLRLAQVIRRWRRVETKDLSEIVTKVEEMRSRLLKRRVMGVLIDHKLRSLNKRLDKAIAIEHLKRKWFVSWFNAFSQLRERSSESDLKDLSHQASQLSLKVKQRLAPASVPEQEEQTESQELGRSPVGRKQPRQSPVKREEMRGKSFREFREGRK